MNLPCEEARAVVSQLMRHKVRGELFDLESDMLLCGTPQCHTLCILGFLLLPKLVRSIECQSIS